MALDKEDCHGECSKCSCGRYNGNPSKNYSKCLCGHDYDDHDNQPTNLTFITEVVTNPNLLEHPVCRLSR